LNKKSLSFKTDKVSWEIPPENITFLLQGSVFGDQEENTYSAHVNSFIK